MISPILQPNQPLPSVDLLRTWRQIQWPSQERHGNHKLDVQQKQIKMFRWHKVRMSKRDQQQRLLESESVSEVMSGRMMSRWDEEVKRWSKYDWWTAIHEILDGCFDGSLTGLSDLREWVCTEPDFLTKCYGVSPTPSIWYSPGQDCWPDTRTCNEPSRCCWSYPKSPLNSFVTKLENTTHCSSNSRCPSSEHSNIWTAHSHRHPKSDVLLSATNHQLLSPTCLFGIVNIAVVCKHILQSVQR